MNLAELHNRGLEIVDINLSSRALEKEVAKVQPQILTPEKAKYVTETRVNINFGLSEKFYKRLKRVQDLESQRLSRPVSLEEAEEVMIDLYLERRDPIEKAKRNIGKISQCTSKTNEHVTGHVRNFSKGVEKPAVKASNKIAYSFGKPLAKTIQKTFTSRIPIPSSLRHQINLRDQGKCSESSCNQERWLDIHHIIPVSQGGQNTLENLKTLCFGHHKLEHLGNQI